MPALEVNIFDRFGFEELCAWGFCLPENLRYALTHTHMHMHTHARARAHHIHPRGLLLTHPCISHHRFHSSRLWTPPYATDGFVQLNLVDGSFIEWARNVLSAWYRSITPPNYMGVRFSSF